VLARSLPKTHRDFIAGLPVCHQEGDYLFVHAGIRPGIALEQQDAADLMWIRHEFLDDDRWHGKVVVHGHTPTPEPQVRHNRIGIDTRAYDSDRLTALVLHGASRDFLCT
jgi:serine/threonine protein phosphatase 1